MAKKLIEKHGTGLVNGKARLPEAQNLGYGQLAVNYTDGNEVIAFKNVDDEMVTFNTANQNEQVMIKQDNDYFKSYNTLAEYSSDQNEYPTISWVEEERTLKYELEEEELPYNVIFDTSDQITDNNSYYNAIYPNECIIKYLTLDVRYPGFKNAKIFTTFEIDGIEMSNSYTTLENGLTICYAIDTKTPRKGLIQINPKPYILSNPDMEDALNEVLYSVLCCSSISYIEIDENYQKMFYEPIRDTYAFTLGFFNSCLKEVKFIGNWLPKGEGTLVSLYGLMSSFNTGDVSLSKRGIKVLIPKDNNTYGSPSDNLDLNADNVTNCTFYSIINALNTELAEQGSPYGITVETY